MADIANLCTLCNVEELGLSSCTLTGETLPQLASKKSKINKLCLGEIEQMQHTDLRVLADITLKCQLKQLKMFDKQTCRFRFATANTLRCEAQQGKISKLCLGMVSDLEENSLALIASFIKDYQVEELEMDPKQPCIFGSMKIEPLSFGIESGKMSIQKLNLSNIRYLSSDDMETIGFVCNWCNIGEMLMSQCDLDQRVLKKLVEIPGKHSIKKLDISYNKNMVDFALVGALISNAGVEQLKMCGCNMEVEHVRQFTKTVNGLKAFKLDLSDNTLLGEESFSLIGRFVQRNDMDELAFRNCNATSSEIVQFCAAVGDSKIRVIDLSCNFNSGVFPVCSFSGKGLHALVDLCSQGQVDQLVVQECWLDEQDEQYLQKNSTEFGFEVLL